MYALIVDGQPWIDSEGESEWKFCVAVTLEELILEAGYADVQFVKVA